MVYYSIFDTDKFMTLCKTNTVTDVTKLIGYNLIDAKTHEFAQIDCLKSVFILKNSGREIKDTNEWNVFTFALLFDKRQIIDYVLKNCDRLEEHMTFGLQKNEYNVNLFSEDQLIDAQTKTLLLMAENGNLKTLFFILNRLHYMFNGRHFE